MKSPMTWALVATALFSLLPSARGDGVADPYSYVCGGAQDKTAEQLRERSQEIETVYQAASLAFSKSNGTGSPLTARELIDRIEQGLKKAKAQGLTSSIAALRADWPRDPALNSALDSYLDYLVMTEEAAIRWVNLKRNSQGAQSLDANRVAELVSLAKDSLKVAISEEPGWTNGDRTAAISEINPVQALTPSRIKAISDPLDRHYLTLLYFLTCGPSGDYVSIFSKIPEAGLVGGRVSHGKPIMAVCPGIIMSLADQPDLVQTLKNVIAHEMAHRFDVSVKDSKEGFLAYDGTVQHRDFSKAYRSFHKCLYQSGYKDLGDARKVISEYKAKSADAFFSEDERARYAFQAELLETKMSRVVTRVGREPTKLETHQEEIDADYWSFSELGQTVNDLPDEPARTRVKQSLSYLCSTTDDGFRPSGRFRIGMAFQNRVIAAKTGYRPVAHSSGPGEDPARVASCQMSGEIEAEKAAEPQPTKSRKKTGGKPIKGKGKSKDNGAAN